MANEIIQNICSQLDSMLDESITILDSAKIALFLPINTLKSTIRNLQYSSQEAIDGVNSSINENMDKFNVPFGTTSAINDVLRVFNQCPILKNKFPNPLSLYRGMQNTVRTEATSLLTTLSSSVSEFNVSKLIDSITQSIGKTGLNLGDIVPGIYSIASCIESICGGSQSLVDKLEHVNSVLESLYIDPSGKFSSSSLYSALNLSLDNISLLERASTIYDDTLSIVDNAINQGISLAKQFSSF